MQNSFDSAVSFFMALKMYDETIESGKEQTKLWEHVVKNIVLLKRWFLQIEQGFFMGAKDKNHIEVNKLVTMHLILLDFGNICLDHLQQFERTSKETCLDGQYLQSIGVDNVEQQWKAQVKQRQFKH